MAIFFCAVVFALNGQASELQYEPINPTFGGNPGNSAHLLSIANIQKTATISRERSTTTSNSSRGLAGGGTTSSGGPKSSENNALAQQFLRQLQSRILSSVSSQVADAIFGKDPKNNGKVKFGDTEVSFTRGADSIALSINDFTTGSYTNITVPLFTSTVSGAK